MLGQWTSAADACLLGQLSVGDRAVPGAAQRGLAPATRRDSTQKRTSCAQRQASTSHAVVGCQQYRQLRSRRSRSAGRRSAMAPSAGSGAIEARGPIPTGSSFRPAATLRPASDGRQAPGQRARRAMLPVLAAVIEAERGRVLDRSRSRFAARSFGRQPSLRKAHCPRRQPAFADPNIWRSHRCARRQRWP